MSGPTGVLVMSYGTPRSPADIERFYTDVRRGRPPAPDQLEDLRRRYAAIGGVSPMAERTDAQVAGIRSALERRAPGGYLVVSGSKHSRPSIEEAVCRLADKGVRRGVGLVLAPHYSALSVGEYIERASSAAGSLGSPIHIEFLESWHLEEPLLEMLSARVRSALAGLAAGGGAGVEVIFTAHSLPARVLDTGDPYATQLEETAEAVAARVPVSRWRTAWQSAGRTPEPWLGPDLLEVLRALPAEGATAAVICPAGFVSDHLEVLYDIDVEARRVAGEVGLAMARTASLNDDPEFTAMLGALVEERASA